MYNQPFLFFEFLYDRQTPAKTHSQLKVRHQVIILQAAPAKKYQRLKGNSAFQTQLGTNCLIGAQNQQMLSLRSLLEDVFQIIDLGELIKFIRISWSFSSTCCIPKKRNNYSLGMELKEICRFIMLPLYQISLRGKIPFFQRLLLSVQQC